MPTRAWYGWFSWNLPQFSVLHMWTHLIAVTPTWNCQICFPRLLLLITTLYSSVIRCIHLEGGCEVCVCTISYSTCESSKKWRSWISGGDFRTCCIGNGICTEAWAFPHQSKWSIHLTGENHKLSLTCELSSALCHIRAQRQVACNWITIHISNTQPIHTYLQSVNVRSLWAEEEKPIAIVPSFHLVAHS